ncbi:MAG: DUF4032 domain-containing protein [Acidimicrobiia bacterium]|nr:DUF4032 domain-containing protein [Acidimicrobiia bacterium]
MGTPQLVVRAGNPDFLDLPWDRSLAEWDHPRRLDLPKGISRHEVHFFGYDEGIYAVKELPRHLARHEYAVLRQLEEMRAPAVQPVGLVERPWRHPYEEAAAAVITRYVEYSFSYRELLSGWGFGDRRNQMLDAFAGLLVELHLLGCHWGDCSLSNVLYRYDAGAVDMIMVDAETARIHPSLSDGQRQDDLQVMVENVAGGMADLAAEQGIDLDLADLFLGEDIAARYHPLWREVTAEAFIGRDEQYRITEQINRLNELGFEVDDLVLTPHAEGSRLRMRFKVAGRNFHSHHLRELTGIEAAENQARQILSDLRYYEATVARDSPAGKRLAPIRWRVEVFEPMLARLRSLPDRAARDPVQAYTDFLHHRYLLSVEAGSDIPNEEAFRRWAAAGQPGYPLG